MTITKLIEHSIPYHIRPKQIDKPAIGNDLNCHQGRRGVITAIKAIIIR